MKEKATNSGTRNPHDLTEEASRRETTTATTESRKMESDDINEDMNPGNVPSPEGDASGENKVATLDD